MFQDPEVSNLCFEMRSVNFFVVKFEEEGGEVNLEDYTGPLRKWLDEPKVQNEIKRIFREFLTSFRDEAGKAVYPERIQNMVVGKY